MQASGISVSKVITSKLEKTPEAAKAEARKAHQFIVDKWDAAEKKAGKA